AGPARALDPRPRSGRRRAAPPRPGGRRTRHAHTHRSNRRADRARRRRRMTDGTLHDPRVATMALLDRLIRRGRALGDAAAIRIWQRDCAEAVNEVSGGSKAHWLSRAYSGALLVRSTAGEAVIEATPAQIVERILDVLARARASIADAQTSTPIEAPQPHRFDFVHDAALRPVLE